MRVVFFHEWAVGDLVKVVFAALRVLPGGTEVDRFTASCKLKVALDNYLKNILYQARCSGEAWVQRKAYGTIFAHDGFSSDFGILAREARFGRLRASQIHKIGCCRTSLGSHDS